MLYIKHHFLVIFYSKGIYTININMRCVKSIALYNYITLTVMGITYDYYFQFKKFLIFIHLFYFDLLKPV